MEKRLMAAILNDLILYPINFILELSYSLLLSIFSSPGLAIAGLSLMISVLTLPIYSKAEAWQDKDRQLRKKLKPGVDRIKSVFKGDERMMILSCYYRQNNYHPAYALRSSTSLLLQIPFFIAAYVFIKSLPGIQGQSFFIIKDLAKPDGLMFGLNLLPIIMTVFNLAASWVYSRDFPKSEKLQLYLTALVFLVLLYQMPAALVLYWTLNNVFSLGKNLFRKTKKPLFLFWLLMASVASLTLAYSIFFMSLTVKKQLFILMLATLILLLPLLVKGLKYLYKRSRFDSAFSDDVSKKIFLYSSISLVLLLGIMIPISLVGSSPQEFSFLASVQHPLYFILRTSLQALSLFFLWPLFIYSMLGKNERGVFSFAFLFLLFAAFIDSFVFTGNYGTISRNLVFPDDALLRPTQIENVFNLLAVLFAFALLVFLALKKKTNVFLPVLLITAISVFSLSLYNGIKTQIEYRQLVNLRLREEVSRTGNPEPMFRMSKSGQNVLHIMLDRAISSIIPDIIGYDENIKKALDGFIWYPNTLSFGSHTIIGTPPSYGGYEYTPISMNNNRNKKLRDKHNEALSVLPRLFSENGWDSAIADAPLANYSWTPDNKIFSGLKDVKAFNIESRFTDLWLAEKDMRINPSAVLEKNLFRFSLFRAMPMLARFDFYNGGDWWDIHWEKDDLSLFVNSFSALYYLDKLFEFDEGKNSYISICNNLTHEYARMTFPDYIPTRHATDLLPTPYDDPKANQALHVLVSALKQLGKLFTELKKNDCWDNTRIIIFADHGHVLDLPAFSEFGDKSRNAANFNPLLLVKDFDAVGEIQTDLRFGTQADIPAIASAGLVEQINPYTGVALKMHNEKEPVFLIKANIIDPLMQSGYAFNYDDSDIVSVKNNIFNPGNWDNL